MGSAVDWCQLRFRAEYHGEGFYLAVDRQAVCTSRIPSFHEPKVVHKVMSSKTQAESFSGINMVQMCLLNPSWPSWPSWPLFALFHGLKRSAPCGRLARGIYEYPWNTSSLLSLLVSSAGLIHRPFRFFLCFLLSFTSSAGRRWSYFI